MQTNESASAHHDTRLFVGAAIDQRLESVIFGQYISIQVLAVTEPHVHSTPFYLYKIVNSYPLYEGSSEQGIILMPLDTGSAIQASLEKLACDCEMAIMIGLVFSSTVFEDYNAHNINKQKFLGCTTNAPQPPTKMWFIGMPFCF